MRVVSGLGLALAIVFGVSGCVDRKAQAAAAETSVVISDPVREVSVTPVTVEDLQEILEVNGEVVTSDDAQISAQASGKLTSVFVKDGDMVSAGQLVATLDKENLLQQANQTRAALASARAQLSQASSNARLTPSRSTAAVKQAEAALRGAKVQLQKALNGSRSEEREQAQINIRAAKSGLDTAKKQLERVKTLVKEGALASSQLDTANNAYEVALAQYENALQASSITKSASRPEDIESAKESVRQAEQGLASAKASKSLDIVLTDQVAAAQAQVASAEATYAVSQKNLREADIRSPFSGRIYGRPLQAGVVVSPGTPIARIVGGNGIYFEGQIPSSAINTVKIGTVVNVSVDGQEGQSYPGKVVAISPQGDSVGRLFNARVQLATASESIKPGMFARGGLVIRTTPQATLVAESAIISRDGQKYVMVLNGEKAKKVVVKTGIRKGTLVEITGVQSDEKIITSGQGALVDGSKIRVAKPEKGEKA